MKSIPALPRTLDQPSESLREDILLTPREADVVVTYLDWFGDDTDLVRHLSSHDRRTVIGREVHDEMNAAYEQHKHNIDLLKTVRYDEDSQRQIVWGKQLLKFSYEAGKIGVPGRDAILLRTGVNVTNQLKLIDKMIVVDYESIGLAIPKLEQIASQETMQSRDFTTINKLSRYYDNLK